MAPLQIIRAAVCAAILAAVSGVAFGVTFQPEERVTSGTGSFQMSRNTNHSMLVDSRGRAHLVYFEGSLESAVTPENPSAIWYGMRSADGVWAEPERVDDSFTSDGRRIGGRQPSLLARPDGRLQVFWHDYRHCTGAARWINNIEIYSDIRDGGGAFSPNDIRITSTTALHSGDNGYAPQAVVGSDGRTILAWYDYHFNASIADICRLSSDAGGRFDTSMPFEQVRITKAGERPSGPSFGFPDIAVGAGGIAHTVWTLGDAPGFGLYYARADGAATSAVVLSGLGAGYWYPPHIVAGPDGTIFTLWTEHGAEGDSLSIARLAPGAASFDSPHRVPNASGEQYHGDLKIGRDGRIHLAWVDTREGGDAIFYGVLDSAGLNLLEEARVSQSSDCEYPAIALDSQGNAYFAWADYGEGADQIHFRTTADPLRSEAGWMWGLYK